MLTACSLTRVVIRLSAGHKAYLALGVIHISLLLPSNICAQNGAWPALIESARQALEAREFDQAKRILYEVRTRSRSFPPDDPRRIVPLMELARLHLHQGDYTLPEQLYREADPIARHAWGPESTEYASLLNDIGRYYHLRVRLADAERFYTLAFGIRTRQLGRDHPDVAASLSNLAVLYENQVRYAKAESYYRTALTIREQTLGSDHVDTIISLEHFSRLLHKLSRPDDAAPLEERSRVFRRARINPVSEAGTVGTLASGESVQPPVLLERSQPEYTDEARIANHEGSVLLAVDVDTNGRARNITLLRHLGLGLDERAVEAVGQWRFRPARLRGEKVATQVRLEIAFRLM